MRIRHDFLPEAMRLLVRHQWVREHGTPRLTVLVGGPGAARALWTDWLAWSGRDRDAATLVEIAATSSRRAVEAAVARAMSAAVDEPRRPAAIAGAARTIASLVRGREDRLAALVGEGVVKVAAVPRDVDVRRARGASEPPAIAGRARSLAELTLFEALEATPATAGRFRLNHRVTVRFGPNDAEVDLLAPVERIAVEVDGFHHFADADAYRRDRRKDLLLQAHGYVVVRVLADDVHADPRAAVRMVCEALAHRARRARVPRGS